MSSLNQIGIHLWNWVSGATEDEAEDPTRDMVRTAALGVLAAAAVGGLAYAQHRRNQWRQEKLDLSRNRLTEAPDVSNNPQLRDLNLSDNQLTIAPDVRHNPQLRNLSLSLNHLTEAPDISHNLQLRDLNLSGNQLTIAPDVSHNLELHTLGLSRNQLTIAPDVRNNLQLKCFDLSSNRLTTAPDVSHNSQLEYLYLNNNKLRTAPDISHNPQLKQLNLYSNRLTEAPDVSHNSQLEVLSLYNNRLTEAFDVSHNSQLRILHLFSNALTVAPDVSNNSQLQILSLSWNQLTIAPDISHNLQLEYLNLSRNQLTIAPDVSHNPQLRDLDLSDNRLTALPDFILSLPRDCNVNVERNLFSAEYVEEFQARLQQHRAEHPGEGPTVYLSIDDGIPSAAILPLDEELSSWAEEFEGHLEGSFTSLLSLDAETKETLSRYLGRLRDTQDYKAGGLARKNVVLRVHRMLQLSNQNEEFRNGVIGLIHEGLGTCGDRVLITFNEIEILWNFLHKELSQEEAKDLSIRAQRYELLKRHAQKECKRRGLGDQIQTILAFHIRLKTALNLPITTKNMLYPKMSGVKKDMLLEAEKKIGSISDEELLDGSFHWQEYIKKTQGLSVVDEIDTRYGDLLEDLATYYSYLSEESEESKKPSRAAAFLESHQNLSELMAEAERKGVPSNYVSMANFISQKREQEIARLGY